MSERRARLVVMILLQCNGLGLYRLHDCPPSVRTPVWASTATAWLAHNASSVICFTSRRNFWVVFSIERELGNDQRCLVDATRLERLAQRWPVTALAALDLGELTNELSATAVQIIENGGLLRFETEAAGTLLCCCCPIPEGRTRAAFFWCKPMRIA
jgi:hypothetical protein